MAAPTPPTPRCFRLRRPAVLSVTDGPFVPPDADLDDVQRRWEMLRRRNPAYFDGRLYHVLGVHRNGHGGAVVHVVDCAYRLQAVQDDDYDLGVRSLGVKGIVRRDGRVLVGRRARSVAAYQHHWEFVPGGVIEPGQTPAEALRVELAEEAALEAVREPTPVAVLYDPQPRTWEIVFDVETAGEPVPNPAEHDELAWRDPGDLPEPLAPVAGVMAGLAARGRPTH